MQLGAACALLWGVLSTCSGCAPHRIAAVAPAPGDCQARVILGLAAPVTPPPAQPWVQALASANGVQLQYLRAITPSLYLFRMTAPEASGGCTTAIERLRADARVSSAQIEQRRKHESD